MDFNHDLGSIVSVKILDPETGVLTVSGTAGLVLPIGTDAERAASTGVIRFNTTSSNFEGYDGTTWVPFQGSTANLTALSNLSGTGFITQTGAGTFEERTIAGTAGNITVTNGDGISGNPTIDLATAGTSGTYVSVTTDAYGRVTSGSSSQAWSTISSTPTTLSGYGITDAIQSLGGIVSFDSGLDASKPAAGNTGAVYYATDTQLFYYDNGTTWDAIIPAYSGDATSTAGGTVLTLATVNSNVGTFGDASHVAAVTVNAKGLVTAVSEVLITPSAIGAINVDQLGVANGVATLDANGTLDPSQIPSSLIGSLQYQGVWDASTNTPTLASGVGTQGHYYKVSVAGSTNIDGGTTWQLGDFIIFNGTAWDHIDGGSSEVISVNGKIGAVALVLASSDFANQGTTTTFLKGNAAGNPSWSAISLTTDVTGTLQAGQFPALTGDITTTAGSLATTLATVNSNVGTFGSSSAVPVITVNEKGLVTAVSTATISSALSFIGDVTGTGTTGTDTTLTLATVNSNVGTFGDSSHVGQFTVNAKGLVTAASDVLITPSAIGAVENLGGSPSMQQDVFANIPAAGNAGAVFIATDTKIIYRDNGTSWDEIGEAAILYTENPSSPTANTVTGINAAAIGSGNTVTGNNAFATGTGAKATLYGSEVHASGSFSAAGDAQSGKYVARNITSNNTPTELFLDGSSAKIVLSDNSAVVYRAQIVGRRTDQTGSEAAFVIEGLISRDASAATTTLVGNRSKTILTRPSGWNADVSADTTNGALVITVTGATGQTIRWAATITTTEVFQ